MMIPIHVPDGLREGLPPVSRRQVAQAGATLPECAVSVP